MPYNYLLISMLIPALSLSATVGWAKLLCRVCNKSFSSLLLSNILGLWILVSLFNISFSNIPGYYLVALYIILGNISHCFGIRNKNRHFSKWDFLLLFILSLWGFAVTWQYFHFPDLNCDDDLTVYFRHIKMFLESGNLDDAYSFRRVASYSGQIFLTGLFTAGSPVYMATMFELGVVNPLIVFLLYEIISKNKKKSIGIAIALTFLLIPQLRINIAPQSTAIYFGLTSCLYLQRFLASLKRTDFIFLLINLFSLLSLRNNLILVVGFFLILAFLAQYKQRLLLSFRDTWLAAVAVTFMFGFSLYRSSETPFFPLISGNFNSLYGLFENEYSKRFFLQYFVAALSWTDLIAVLFCLLYLCSDIKKNRYFIFLQIISIILILATAYSLRGMLIPWHPARYSEGISTATILLTLLHYIGEKRKSLKSNLIILPVAIFIFSNTPIYFVNFYVQNFSYLDPSFFNSYVKKQSAYAELQSHIQEGQKIISMVNEPYLFDYSKNRIENLEIIGAASPRNEFDGLGTSKEIDRYFRSTSASALVFQDLSTTSCHYAPALYERLLKLVPFKKAGGLYQLDQDRLRVPVPSVINYTPHFHNFFSYLKTIEPTASRVGNFYIYNLHGN